MTHRQSTKVPLVCARCGTSFSLKPSAIAHGQGTYCSRACQFSPRPLTPHPTIPDCMIVSLTKGKVALIDVADAERVQQHTWSAAWTGQRWYARRGGGGRSNHRSIYLHRFLLNAPDDIHVDHENNDGLDCRQSNIRLATISQNGGNCGPRKGSRSGFRGVGWSTKEGKWIAQIQCQGRHQRIGCFTDPEEAARAYDAKAIELFGEFAHPNFPDCQTA